MSNPGGSGRTQAALAGWARLAYTSLFERIIETAVSATGIYGALMSVEGAVAPVTISTPNVTVFTAIGQPPKMCFDFGVVNADGAQPITLSAPDARTINGLASIVLPASPGASALLFYDTNNGDWIAILGGGSGSLAPPLTSTTTTPIGFAVTTVDTPAVVSPAVVTATGQKVLVMFSCEIDSDAAAAHTATFSARVDGGAAIDTFLQTSTTVGSEIVSWHFEVTPVAGSHVYQVNVHADANGIYNLVTGALRLTTVTLPG